MFCKLMVVHSYTPSNPWFMDLLYWWAESKKKLCMWIFILVFNGRYGWKVSMNSTLFIPSFPAETNLLTVGQNPNLL